MKPKFVRRDYEPGTPIYHCQYAFLRKDRIEVKREFILEWDRHRDRVQTGDSKRRESLNFSGFVSRIEDEAQRAGVPCFWLDPAEAIADFFDLEERIAREKVKRLQKEIQEVKNRRLWLGNYDITKIKVVGEKEDYTPCDI